MHEVDTTRRPGAARTGIPHRAELSRVVHRAHELGQTVPANVVDAEPSGNPRTGDPIVDLDRSTSRRTVDGKERRPRMDRRLWDNVSRCGVLGRTLFPDCRWSVPARNGADENAVDLVKSTVDEK
jgi:hypothetical protein